MRKQFSVVTISMILMIQSIVLSALTEQTPSTCNWTGPSADWVLSMRPSLGEASGSLGLKVLPLFHRHGILVSFISRPNDDAPVQLESDAGTTVNDLLEQIVAQAPAYRYSVVGGRVVIYPKGEEYDRKFEVAPKGGVTRAQAMFPLLKELKAQSQVLHGLEMPTLRGPGGRLIYGERVEVGGSHSVVEHLVALMWKRSTAAFEVLASGKDHLSFEINSVALWKKFEVSAPATVEVGAIVRVSARGILVDGSVVDLAGPDCGVTYSVSEGGVLEIDNQGTVVARNRGFGTIYAEYEGRTMEAKVRVL